MYSIRKIHTSFFYFLLPLCLLPASLASSSSDDNTHTIVLMGDSVLDNFYWLKNKKLNLTYQLRNMKYGKSNYKVCCYAVDQAKLHDVLDGQIPENRYVNERKKQGIEEYPTEKDGKVYPLKLFKKNHSQKAETTVLISVGGNEIVLGPRESQKKIIENFLKLEKKYQRIIDRIREANAKARIIFVIPYFPQTPKFFSNAHYSKGLKLNAFKLIYGELFSLISKITEKNKCQLINLSVTFNPFDDHDYGSTSIEPSSKSSQYIADLTDFIIKNEKQDGKSYLYTGKKGNIKVVANNEKAREVYPTLLSRQLSIKNNDTNQPQGGTKQNSLEKNAAANKNNQPKVDTTTTASIVKFSDEDNDTNQPQGATKQNSLDENAAANKNNQPKVGTTTTASIVELSDEDSDTNQPQGGTKQNSLDKNVGKDKTSSLNDSTLSSDTDKLGKKNQTNQSGFVKKLRAGEYTGIIIVAAVALVLSLTGVVYYFLQKKQEATQTVE